jgi:hypothetical protein
MHAENKQLENTLSHFDPIIIFMPLLSKITFHKECRLLTLKKPDVSKEHIAPILKMVFPRFPPACPGILLGLPFDPEDGGDVFPRNVGISPKYTVLERRRLHAS